MIGRLVTFLGASLLFASACGDDGGGISLDDYGPALRAARCERLARCGLFSSTDACELAVVDTFASDLRGGVDAKKIRFSGTRASECLTALAAQSCDATSEDARVLPDACVDAFVGTIADGGECALDAECISGSCDQPACTRDECCVGTCAQTITDAPIDGACIDNTDCIDGAFCGADSVCHPLAAERGACKTDNECGYGLACIGASDLQDGLCRALPPIGTSCPYMRCADIGATCIGGTCVAVGLTGTACPMGSECSPFGECAPDAMCRELPQLGEACTLQCVLGSWCDGGTCVGGKGDNEACSNDGECTSNFCTIGPVFDYCSVLPVCS